jgi:hypothetical protein
MPYIKEDRRLSLDECIENMTNCLILNAYRESFEQYPSENNKILEKLSNDQFLSIVGDINYTFSRVLSGVMGEVSYSKIALITGVLENIKQEFYRRVAGTYEDKKIVENGDIKEYKRL